MAGPVIQNFSVPAGDTVDLDFDVDPDDGVSLIGSTIYWSVYALEHGVPIGDTVLEKYTDHGLEVTDPTLLKFTVSLVSADTVGWALGNYYYQTRIDDGAGNLTTTTIGIMTLTKAVPHGGTA